MLQDVGAGRRESERLKVYIEVLKQCDKAQKKALCCDLLLTFQERFLFGRTSTHTDWLKV
jgi:hypothetical protein